ncbi:Hypothetical protein (Fragment) [Durusdinium trenchii]|uniref:Uncharacterized protein n=1 Tax=Durusdinium trenchii TaxID=1381693 RepID=A0ABP0RRM7_9DINO
MADAVAVKVADEHATSAGELGNGAASAAGWGAKAKVLALIAAVAVVGGGAAAAVLVLGGDEPAKPLGPIGASLCSAPEDCSSGQCGAEGQCLCVTADDCQGEEDVCEVGTGTCVTPVDSGSLLGEASDRAEPGQKVTVEVANNITCDPSSSNINIAGNRDISVKGDGSIGDACNLKVGAGTSLEVDNLELRGSIEVEEGAKVNLTNVVLDMEVCPIGWTAIPGSPRCFFAVSEFGLPLSLAKASELCSESIGDEPLVVPSLADVGSQEENDLVAGILDGAAWLSSTAGALGYDNWPAGPDPPGSPCRTITPDFGTWQPVSCADATTIKFAVCMVPKRLPIFPPSAAQLKDTTLLINSPETFRLVAGELLFPGDPSALEGLNRRELQEDPSNNTVVVTQRDAVNSARAITMPLSVAASNETWEVELDLDVWCINLDLNMRIGTDQSDDVTIIQEKAPDFQYRLVTPLNVTGDQLPKTLFVTDLGECTCIYGMKILKGGVEFIDYPVQVLVDYECRFNFPGIILEVEGGCLQLDNPGLPTAVHPPEFAFKLEGEGCDRFSLQRHPSFGTSYELKITMEDGIEGVTFIDDGSGTEFELSSAGGDEYVAVIDERFPKLPTRIRAIGNATLGTPKLLGVQVMYGADQVSHWLPSETHDCFKVCPAVQTAAMLDFAVVQEVVFNLGETNFRRDVCDLIDDITTYVDLAVSAEDTQDASITCTAPTQFVLVTEVQNAIDTLKSDYRTIPVVINASESAVELRADVPRNVRLELEQVDETRFRAVVFIASGGDAEFRNLYTDTGVLETSGDMTVEGCDLFDTIVNVNERAKGTIAATYLNDGTVVQSRLFGNLTLELTTFGPNTRLFTQPKPNGGPGEDGRATFASVDIEDNSFVHAGTAEVKARSLQGFSVNGFLDLNKKLVVADSSTDPACADETLTPLVEVESLDECQALCESDTSCEGFFFDAFGPGLGDVDEVGPLCGLCRPSVGVPCQFDCSSDSSAFFKYETPVTFVNMGGTYCPLGSGIPHPTSVSVQECMGWCNSKAFCSVMRHDSSDNSCILYDVPAMTLCGAPDPSKTLYIDTEAATEFIELPAGVCVSTSTGTISRSEIASGSPAILGPFKNCAAVCTASSSHCVAFEFTNSLNPMCTFFDGEPSLTACTSTSSTTSVDLTEAAFPALAEEASSDLVTLGCGPPKSDAAASFTVASYDKCKAKCDQDVNCFAFSFQSGEAAVNCWTFYPTKLDSLFDAASCLADGGLTTTKLVLRRTDFVEATGSETLACGADTFPAIEVSTLDQCKKLCTWIEGCTTIAYDITLGSCQLSCNNEDRSQVAATHVLEPGALGETSIEYFGVTACTEDVVEISVGDVATQPLTVDLCKVLCDLNSECIGYSTSTPCSLVRDVELQAPLMCPQTVDLEIAFKGIRNFEYVVAPTNAEFADSGTVVPEAQGSVTLCLEACSGSISCEAATLQSSDGACVHWASRKFSETAPVDDGQSFIAFTGSFFEDAFVGAEIKGSTILRTLNGVPREACMRTCRLTNSCQSFRHDAATGTCEIRAGELVVTSDKAYSSRIKVAPFTEVTDDVKLVCPDPAALLSSSTPGDVFYLEECEALCEAHRKCGSITFNAETRVCKLFDAQSFVVDTPACRTDAERFYMSYLQFLERSSRSFVSLGKLDIGSNFLCSADTPVDEVSPLGEPECEAACKKNLDCAAYVLDGTTCRLLPLNASFSPCVSEVTTGVKFVRTSFSRLGAGECLAETTTVINQFGLDIRVPECAAFCEAHFECRAFRMHPTNGCELFESTSASASACSAGDEEAYVYFSDKTFTRLDSTYCVASSSELASLDGVEVEACKELCDRTEGCAAIEHNAAGECVLFRTSDFFSCTDTARDLYISHRNLVGDDKKPFTMAVLEGFCFEQTDFLAPSCSPGGCGWAEPCSNDGNCETGLQCIQASQDYFGGSDPLARVCMGIRNSDKDQCANECLADSQCVGIVFYPGAGANVCLKMDQAQFDKTPPRRCSAPSVAEFQIKFETNPYRKLNGKCPKNSLSARVGPFTETSLVDCMILCDSFSACRHFTLTDTGVCELFGAQIGGVDEDDCEADAGTLTYINVRSFVDAVEFMGEPEVIFAEIPGISYQECAAACAGITECYAFLHDWNSRQSSGFLDVTVEPQRLATPTRATVETKAWELSGTGSVDLVSVRGVDEIGNQRVFIEELSGNEVKVRFFVDDLCLTLSGSNLVVAACSTSDENQRFLRDSASDGYLTLAPVSLPAQCVSWFTFSTSSDLTLQPCSSATARWDLLSAPVRLTTDEDKVSCLTREDSSPASMSPCSNTDEDQLWVYTFLGQQWMYHGQAGLFPVCLTVDGSGNLVRGACDATRSTFALEPEQVIRGTYAGGTSLCMSGSTAQMLPCSPGTPSQSWSRYAVCKLSTRERSPPIALESVEVPGQCLKMTAAAGACSGEPASTASLVSCSSNPDLVQYSYRSTNPARQLILWDATNQNQCVGRDGNDGLEWKPCVTVQDYVDTNWVLDFQDGSFKAPVEGQEDTFLSASICSSRAMEATEAQIGALGLGKSWRQYQLQGTAVEISVRPSATVLEITDPVLLFQIWLWSDFGVKSRQLLSKVEVVSDTVDRLVAFVGRSTKVIDRAQSVLTGVESALSPVLNILGEIVDFLNIAGPILIFFEKIPYVGPIIKLVRLRTILNNAKKGVDKAKNTGGRLGTVALAGTGVVSAVLTRVVDSVDSLNQVPSILRGIGALVVRLVRCAFSEVNEAVQTGLENVMDTIIQGVDAAQLIVRELTALVEPVGEVVDVVVTAVLKPIQGLRQALRPIGRLLDVLSFIPRLFAFSIPIKYPVGIHWKRGCVCCKCLTIKWKEFRFGLEAIAGFVDWLNRVIRKIPIIGWMVGLIDKFIQGVLGKLFPRIELPLPRFGFLENFNLLDDIGARFGELVDQLEEKLDDIRNSATEFIEDAMDMVDFDILDGLMDRFPVLSPFPDCSNITCLFEPLGLPTFDADILENVMFVFNQSARVQEVISSEVFNDKLTTVMDFVEGCNKYEELPIVGLGELARTIGLNGTEVCEELLQDGARNLDVCTEFAVGPGAETALTDLTQHLETELAEIRDSAPPSRRRLGIEDFTDATGTPMTFSFTVAIPLDSVASCYKGGKSLLYRHAKAVQRTSFGVSTKGKGQTKTLMQRRGRDGDIEDTSPHGRVWHLERKEVVGISLSINTGGISFGIGLRAQAQFRVQYITNWARFFNVVATKLAQIISTEEEAYEACSLQDWFPGEAIYIELAGSGVCPQLRSEYDRINGELRTFKTLYAPGASSTFGSKKWSELSVTEQNAAFQWFNRNKNLKLVKPDKLESHGRKIRAILRSYPKEDRDPYKVACAPRLGKVLPNSLFQLRFSSQQGNIINNVKTPIVPFAGFQVNFGALATFRKDFHIFPAVDPVVTGGDRGVGAANFFGRAGNNALMFSFGALGCLGGVFNKGDALSKCVGSLDTFLGASAHLGFSVALFKTRLLGGNTPILNKVKFLGILGAGEANDQEG